MEQLIYIIAAGYIIFMSLLGFLLMGIDKRRACKNAWRISEKTLLLTAILGGGIGSFLGMYFFRHKTRHLAFVLLLPLAAVADLVILIKVLSLINV